MLVVYAMLGHAGAETGTVYPGLATGARCSPLWHSSCSAGRALCSLRPFL